MLLPATPPIDDGDGGIVQSSQSVTINNSDPNLGEYLILPLQVEMIHSLCLSQHTDANNHTLTHSLRGHSMDSPSHIRCYRVNRITSKWCLCCQDTLTFAPSPPQMHLAGRPSASASVTITNTPLR